ncbi:hypothetical protein R1sor_019963 [Riccia sorocarpa]|uniref:NERD domain-containing protein n=1 Tax=Riccia sorocarpa TaxID=122646 RepID=A0ABD3IF45_9MARC
MTRNPSIPRLRKRTEWQNSKWHSHSHSSPRRGGSGPGGGGVGRSLGLIAQAAAMGMATMMMVSLYRRLRGMLLLGYDQTLEETDSDRAGRLAELKVADVFQSVPGVQVYSCLRIPDTGRRGRREIDIVLLLKRELYVLEVKNWSGEIRVQPDGSWCQIRRNGSIQTHPNIVEETKYRASLLESYITRRGVKLPQDFVQSKVVLMNEECRPEQAIMMQREVLLSDQWQNFLDRNSSKGFTGWLKKLVKPNTKTEGLNEATRKQLQFILSTAPTWDRLVLVGGSTFTGDFQRFKGTQEDLEALRGFKRSSYSQLLVSHQRSWLPQILGAIFGARPYVKLVLSSRDYRDGNPGWSDRKQQEVVNEETEVRSGLEIMFRVVGQSKLQSFPVNKVLSMSLSA